MHGTFAQIAVEPRRIYLDDRAEIFCTVSPEDYQWLIRWRWHFVMDRWKTKYYARRTTRCQGRQIHMWMHKAILTECMGILPPSEAHHIGDHGNGNSLCNERWNLSWATKSMNRRNRRR